MQYEKNVKYVKWVDFQGSKIFEDIYRRLRVLSTNSRFVFVEDLGGNVDVFHYHRLDREYIKKSKALNVATIHFDLNDNWMFKDRSLFLDNLNRIDEFICLNKSQIRSLVSLGYDSRRMHLIPHAFDNKALLNFKQKSDYGYFNNKIKVGFFSKRYKNKMKGENLLYQIALGLDVDHFEFILSGVGREVEKKKLESIGFSVKLVSDSIYNHFISIYKMIDVVLVLSQSEGGPACLPDALASGVNVLSTAVGMSNDIESKKLTILNDVDDFVDVLKSYYCEGIPSKEATVGLCSWVDVLLKHEKVYIL